MSVVAIIQARCGSTRLKDKVLADVDGKPLIGRVVDRVKQAKKVDQIVIATTRRTLDDGLVKWCLNNSIDYFRGSESNVLERYYECAKFYNANIVVRITADDPLKDPIVIDHAISLLIENTYDYVSNTIKPTFPEGVDVEVFTFYSLERAFKNAMLDSEKEHVTPYIWKNKNKFSLFNFKYKRDLSHLRWTVDYIEDLEFVRDIYKKIKDKKCFLMEDVLNVLDKYPELDKRQKKVARNEGYIKSINGD